MLDVRVTTRRCIDLLASVDAVGESLPACEELSFAARTPASDPSVSMPYQTPVTDFIAYVGVDYTSWEDKARSVCPPPRI